MTPDGDYQCRLVSMTVTTATNLVFTVEGRRNTVQTPLESGAPPKPQCTLNASADTYASTQEDGPGKNFGTDVEWVVQGVGKKTGFLRIDLLSPCQGEGEPRVLPGGKRITSAELSLWLTYALDTKTSDYSYRLTTVPPAFRWSEYTLRGNGIDLCTSMPDMPVVRPEDPLLPLASSLPCSNNSNGDWFGTFSINAVNLELHGCSIGGWLVLDRERLLPVVSWRIRCRWECWRRRSHERLSMRWSRRVAGRSSG